MSRLGYTSWKLKDFDADPGWPTKIKLATNLEALSLTIVDENPVFYFFRYRALQHFSKLKVMKLSLSGSMRLDHPTMVELLEEKLGQTTRKLDRYTGNSRIQERPPFFGTWIWEAEKGQTVFTKKT